MLHYLIALFDFIRFFNCVLNWAKNKTTDETVNLTHVKKNYSVQLFSRNKGNQCRSLFIFIITITVFLIKQWWQNFSSGNYCMRFAPGHWWSWGRRSKVIIKVGCKGWGCRQPQEVSLTVRSSSITLLLLSFVLCSRDLTDKNTQKRAVLTASRAREHETDSALIDPATPWKRVSTSCFLFPTLVGGLSLQQVKRFSGFIWLLTSG